MVSAASGSARAARGLSVTLIIAGLLMGETKTVLAQSQAIDGTIEGFVRGQNGDPIADASVLATNVRTGYERRVTTDAAGRYFMPLLPPGEYVIQASKQGFATVSRANLEVSAGHVLTIEVDLSSTAFAETLEVTAASPTIEVGRTVVSNTLDERTVRALPLAGRSIQDFYIVQPGVNAGPPDGGSGSGTPTISTVYGGLGLRQMNIDGVSNNLQGGARNLVISEESIAEFQTVTNFLRRVRPRRRRTAERDHAIRQQRAARLGLFVHAAEVPELDRRSCSRRARRNRISLGTTSAEPWADRWSRIASSISSTTSGGWPMRRRSPRSGAADARGWGFPGQHRHVSRAIPGAYGDRQSGCPGSRRTTASRPRYFYYYDRESPNTFGRQPDSRHGGALRRGAAVRDDPARVHLPLEHRQRGPLPVRQPRHQQRRRGQPQQSEHQHQRRRQLQRQRERPSPDSRARACNSTRTSRSSRARTRSRWAWTSCPSGSRNASPTSTGRSPSAGSRPWRASVGRSRPTDQFILTESGAIDPATGQRYSYSRFTQSIGPEYQEARTINQGYFFQDDFRLTEPAEVERRLAL